MHCTFKSDSVINSIPSATMKVTVTLAALAASVAAHGGLTFPPPRNNYRNIAPTNLRYVQRGLKVCMTHTHARRSSFCACSGAAAATAAVCEPVGTTPMLWPTILGHECTCAVASCIRTTFWP